MTELPPQASRLPGAVPTAAPVGVGRFAVAWLRGCAGTVPSARPRGLRAASRRAPRLGAAAGPRSARTAV
ncbi:hypothetical protein [Streptomyces fradiae]|uniref:hypothetical protein n=1 Tax=Streptomyces fradiae TaxID=1906 RepID=UPI0035BE8595